MRHFLFSVLLAFVFLPVSASDQLKDGDIVFQTSRSYQSVAVQRATGSKYSHMGIVFFRAGKPYVLEAVSTVKFTPLDQWTARGAKGHFVVKRLRNSGAVLNAVALERLRQEAGSFAGRPYDLTFEWTDDRIYCSELVWKAYDRSLGIQIGKLQKVRDFNLSDPSVKAKMRERYGSDIPMSEPVISPVAMFESPLLVTVYAN
ncbi:MAG: YiiX family permuted papain-like enzyme [Rhizobacter sp.]